MVTIYGKVSNFLFPSSVFLSENNISRFYKKSRDNYLRDITYPSRIEGHVRYYTFILFPYHIIQYEKYCYKYKIYWIYIYYAIIRIIYIIKTIILNIENVKLEDRC